VPDRREESPNHTDRPNGHDSLPTVREVLAIDAVAAGMPQVLVGDAALDARVRWVHASDSDGVARLLDGGELLLSTGSSWPADPRELTAFVRSLVEAGLSALFLELGAHYRYAPAVVVETAREQGLAVVALRREVKFVAVTEAVHRRIIADQSTALRARDEVRARFTTLALRGSPADYIVHQLAQTLAAPVVLESLAHEVIVADVPPAREEELLTRWEVRSRLAHRDAAPPDGRDHGRDATGGWLIVPVEARGIRWGYLVALPGPAHPAGRAAVLEQGAIALALGRLTAGATDEWARVGQRQLVDSLLGGRFTTLGGATARLEAAGLPVDGARLYGMVATGVGVDVQTASAAAAALGGRVLVGGAPASAPGPAATLLLSLPARTAFDADEAARFADALAAGAGSAHSAGEGSARGAGGGAVRGSATDTAQSAAAAQLSIAVGTGAAGVEGALASIQEAIDLSRTPTPRGGRGPRVIRAQERPLARLVTALRDDHRVLDHGERMLAPLIEYDLARGGDLLDVLAAMLAHPGNRTAAASASHLSRSVFYQRIALIQELLDVDLDDGEIQTALHLALLVRRSAAS
jgi:purine catabolism regulator